MTSIKQLKESFQIGNIGESFIEWYCSSFNIPYKKATQEQNISYGIDCWVDSIATDVKNTSKIFLGNYLLDQDKFYTRHPFRYETKSKNYIILDFNTEDDNTKNFQIKYIGSISHYLSSKYFRDPISFEKAKQALIYHDNRTYKSLNHLSVDSFLMNLKTELMKYLQPRIYCEYTSTEEATRYNRNELSISLITYEDHKVLLKQKDKI